MFVRELRPHEKGEIRSFLTNDTPFDFQKYTLDFIEQSGGRTGIFHEQGLGKTVCAALALRAHKESMLPALVICKANLSFQWMKQYINWVDENGLVQIIDSTKDWILPNCHMYVISYDLLWRMPAEKIEQFKDIKTVIIDECQHIRNVQTKRANNVRAICKERPYVMALSGTPIKNHAGEYFSILNILKPERFPSAAYYEAQYVDKYWNGHKFVVGGLKNEARFREQTDDFIIRFEQSEVQPDMPPLVRDFKYFDIDKDLRKAYDKTEMELIDYVNTQEDDSSFEQQQHILSYLNRMRQITAVAKVGATVDEIREILENTDEKIIVFLHHHIARDILMGNLEKIAKEIGIDGPLSITEKNNRDARENIKQDFIRNPRKRILVLGTLASGEGVDGLQEVCSRMIMMERQWNPANEEQAEKRLHRIGQGGASVKCGYPIAIGTIDEMFTEMVERKRQQVKQTMGDSEVIEWQESNTVRALVDAIMVKRGGKKWSMAV